MIRKLLYNRENFSGLAAIDDGREITYGELARRAAAVQAELLTGRESPGADENIAVFLPNGAAYIAALYGVFASGMTAFPLGVQMTAHEIVPLLEYAHVRAVVTSGEYRALFEEIGKRCQMRVIYIDELPDSRAEPPYKTQPMNADTPIILLATSGTTGNAKLVRLLEKNVENTVLGFTGYNDYEKYSDVEIRCILGTPFSSVYGLLIISACLLKSFPIVIPRGAFTLETLFGAAEKYKVTHYEGGTSIPLLMDKMAGRAVPYDISSLRFVGFGGSRVSADILARLAVAYPGIDFCPGYGMTESASLITRPYKKHNEQKLDSVGGAIPGVVIMVEADGVITDTPRVMGEIVAKGPNIMPGYYGNEEETRKIIKNGYLYTGDVGYLDEDGDLFICGRLKNVIMVRGFSVFAEEVEERILTSGLARDCVVYGAVDPNAGEIVCADIVPSSQQCQPDDIRGYLRERLAPYKQPRRIRLVEEIKKTSTGKTERSGAGDGVN